MNIQTFDSPIAVAEAAARDAAETLSRAVTTHGRATWVLAGGSTPNLAYEILSESYRDYLDWSKVTFLIGDERIGPLNGPDNNWQIIEQLFLQHIPDATFIRPKSDLPAEEAAVNYADQISLIVRFDLTWLGMGEDGHTLSLFPNHPDFNPDDDRLVIPIHNSPKPPADRISLTLRALTRSEHTVILATGAGKKDALTSAFIDRSDLPIAQAARQTTDTLWLLDEAATPSAGTSS